MGSASIKNKQIGKTKTIVILIIIVIVVIVSIVIPQLIFRTYSGDEVGRTIENPASLGMSVQYGDFTIQAKSIGYGGAIYTSYTNYYIIPGRPYYILKVNVNITCKKDSSESCDPYFFDLIDSSGGSRGGGLLQQSKIPSYLKSDTLMGGETIEGDLFFLVPNDSEYFILVFSTKSLWLEHRSNCAFIKFLKIRDK